ncbi:MAG: hypothetical protein ACOY0T_13445 [Myxococcota bacterium]
MSLRGGAEPSSLRVRLLGGGLITIGLALAAVTAHLATQLRAERAAFTKALAQQEERIAELNRQLTEARTNQSQNSWVAALALRQREDTPTTNAQPANVPAPEPASVDLNAIDSPEGPVTPDELLAAQRFEVDRLEKQFKEEPLDEAWAPGATKRVEEVSARLPAGMRLERVSCRSSMCRVELSHRDPQTRNENLRALAAASPFQGGIYVDVPEDARKPSVAYFSRPGHELAAFADAAPLLTAPELTRGE